MLPSPNDLDQNECVDSAASCTESPWIHKPESRASFFGELGELPIAGENEYQQYSLGFRAANPTDKATTAPVRVENHDTYKSRVRRLVVPASGDWGGLVFGDVVGALLRVD